MLVEHRPDRASVLRAPGSTPRTLTVLHPALGARYTSLVAGVCSDVEARLSPRVAANRVCSASVDPPALRLEPWRAERRAFDVRLRRLAEAEGCLVFADVRDCFGRIGPSLVEDSLRRLGCDPGSAGSIGRFLERLGALGVRGLPVGPRPSAVLANAVLARVDDRLGAAGVRHLRWVDDVVAGAPEPGAGSRVLELLRDELALAGLELNEAKTRIVCEAEGTASATALSPGRARPPVG